MEKKINVGKHSETDYTGVRLDRFYCTVHAPVHVFIVVSGPCLEDL